MTRDSSSTATWGVGTSKSWNHTIANANEIVLVWGHAENGTLSATYNGVAMTLVSSATITTLPANAGRTLSCWFVQNPPTGTSAIVVSTTTSSFMGGMAVSYIGASTTGQPEASSSIVDGTTGGGAGTTSLSTTLTTLTNNAWMAAGVVGTTSSSAGTGAMAATPIVLSTSGDGFLVDSNGPLTPAGSKTYGASWSGTNAALMIGVSLAPAASPTAVHSLMSMGMGA